MSAPLLTHIHRQRIAWAVSVARRGQRPVEFKVDGEWDHSYLVWQDRQRHVVATGSRKSMHLMLPVAQAEFARQMRALDAAKEFDAISQGKERCTATG